MNGNLLNGNSIETQRLLKAVPFNHTYKKRLQMQINPYGYIYRLTCKINNKVYIGQTIRNPKKRFMEHRRMCCKDQPKLYNALLKYGPENFIYEIFDDSASNQEELDFLEEIYICCFNSIEYGYNSEPGGQGKGKVFSDETKKKLSLKATGRKHTIETKQKISKANSKYIRTENHKQLISKALKGHKDTNETKQKRLNSFKLSGYTPSIETRQKISEANRRRKISNETRQKMSLSHKKLFRN